MIPKLFPVSVIWVEWKPGRKVPVIRNRRLEVIEPFLDYVLVSARARFQVRSTPTAFKSYMENIGYGLIALARFLSTRPDLEWSSLTNDALSEFLEWTKDRTKANPRSRNEESAKRTANARMRVVYDFLTWAQEDALLITNMVGNTQTFAVRSSLPRMRHDGHKGLRKERDKYPLLYQDVGSNSRTSDRQYWATDEDFEQIRQYFWETSGIEAAERNDLMLRLLHGQGWRRASVNSLTVDLFDDALIKDAVDAGETHISVIPPHQKRGYKRAFAVPIAAALSVRRYIDGGRKTLLTKRGVDEKDVSAHQNRIFISVTTCLPLTEEAISEIFRRAFRAAGRPVGANTHSFRRAYAETRWAEEIEFRQREGLSLAYEDIAMAVADDLGHASIVSQDAYHRILSRVRKQSVEQGLRNRIADLSDQVASQRSLILQMRRTMTKLVDAGAASNLRTSDDLYADARVFLEDAELA